MLITVMSVLSVGRNSGSCHALGWQGPDWMPNFPVREVRKTIMCDTCGCGEAEVGQEAEEQDNE